MPVALGKNRAYSHCACFPLETFHPVYIILYMASSHATTSCKNTSSYTLTMSGLFNGWIQGHQEITCDSVDCLPWAGLGGFLPDTENGAILSFWRKSLKSSFLSCSLHAFFAAFHNGKEIILVSQLNFRISNFCGSPCSIEFLSCISNRSCRMPGSYSQNGATCYSGWTGFACTEGPNSVPFLC